MSSAYSQVQTCSSDIPSWVAAKKAALLVCRSWVLSDLWGKQEGKQYVLSDYGGFVVQALVHCNNPTCNLCTLVEGEIYSFTNFQLMPNTSLIQFRKQGMNTLDMSMCNSVIHLPGPPHGFTRKPVNLVALEDIEQSDEKFHIDVMGWVIAVGVSRPTKRGNYIVDCHIMNLRGTNVKIMLWNEAASSLLCYEERNRSNNICVFTYMDVREYKGNIFLSSTAATSVHMAEHIPSVTSELRKYASARIPTIDAQFSLYEGEKDHSLSQVLYIGRANKYNQTANSVTANCTVKIVGMRKDQPWFSFTCPLNNCLKEVVKVEHVFWCNTCEQICPYTVPSYRLHLDVTDEISTTTIAYHDTLGEMLVQRRVHDVLSEMGEDADPNVPPTDLLAVCGSTQIVQLKSHTYVDHLTHESFACNAIILDGPNVKVGIIGPPGPLSNVATNIRDDDAGLFHIPPEKNKNEFNMINKKTIWADTLGAKPRKAKRARVYSSNNE